MRRQRVHPRRAGTVIPMIVVSVVALLGLVALAIDVGLLMVARNQCQHVADAGAMAGCRTLNGDVLNNNNYANAGPAIIQTATSCYVMARQVQTSQVAYEIGYYTYSPVTNKFGPLLPSSGQTMPTNENWTLARVTVSSNTTAAFAQIFGIFNLQASASATSVHRPRDTVIIMDYSGSMSFDSLLGGDYSGNRTQSLNPDTVYPQFGHYAGYNSCATSPLTISSGEVLGFANTAADTNAGSAIVNDFYQNAMGGSPLQAFTPALDSYATTPGGDIPLRGNFNAPGQPYATCVQDITNGSSTYNLEWETNGYSSTLLNGGGPALPFYGYTMGPRYWGKSFFIWPPDPRPTFDWRKKFFFAADGVTPLNDNTALWTAGTAPANKAPRTSSATNYYINYAAILRWLTTSPNPFPSQLRAGRILYYSAIPDASNPLNDSALNTRFRVTNPVDLNERFWKHYIDFVLGFQQTGTGPVYTIINPNVGYGDDFTWGTLNCSTPPTLVNGTIKYMSYTDNPKRPKTRFWFGGMTMVDFIDNYNQDRRWMPGTAHQAPLWACKIGMRAAIRDIQNNHPNDYVSLSFFSTPAYAANDGGKFNRVRSPLGRSYQRMIDSLFYPVVTIDDPVNYPEIRCYDTANMLEVPRANGATCPVMSFMHAYNQFSSNSSLINYNPSPAPPGDAGGLGRKGAQKMIIFMTDGVANTAASANFVNSGAYQSYYRIRIPGEYPTNSTGTYASVEDQIYGVANQICALDTASSPGYSTPRKPAIIHCIAFGTLFDTAAAPGASAARTDALRILQTVQTIGKTQSNATTPLPSYKVIIGSSTQRVNLMQTCFAKIMQETISVTLVE